MTTQAAPPPNHALSRLPAEPLRSRVLLAAGLGWIAVAVSAGVLHGALGTPPQQPLVALVVFTAIGAVALVTVRDSHPYPRFGAANRVTMARAVLVALTASLIAASTDPPAGWTLVVMTALVAALDGVDGWFARRTKMSSVFGARFDMETDAFFMLVLSALVWRHGKAGAWVMGIGLMRYAFVMAGWLMPWLARPLRSTIRGKTMAVVALVTMGMSLAPVVPVWLSTSACAAALAALTWSFAVDVEYLWKQR